MLRRSAESVAFGGSSGFEDSSSSSAQHPSVCFHDASDLTLSDDCPFVVFEHTEQQPFIINNAGMAIRIRRYVRPLQDQHNASSSSGSSSSKQDAIRREEERLQVYFGDVAYTTVARSVATLKVPLMLRLLGFFLLLPLAFRANTSAPFSIITAAAVAAVAAAGFFRYIWGFALGGAKREGADHLRGRHTS